METQEQNKENRISSCSGYSCKKSCICSRYITHCKAKEKGQKLEGVHYVDAIVCVKHNFVNFIEVQL